MAGDAHGSAPFRLVAATAVITGAGPDRFHHGKPGALTSQEAQIVCATVVYPPKEEPRG